MYSIAASPYWFFVVVVVLPSTGYALDHLTASDDESLTMNLNLIATDAAPGWPQAPHDAAVAILIKPEYSAAAWENYFNSYFETSTFTTELFNFLHNPVLNLDPKLQNGIVRPVLDKKIFRHWESAAESSSMYFKNSLSAREDMTSSLNLLVLMGTRHKLTLERKNEIFNELLDFIDLQETTLKRSVTLPPETHPYYATHRMHYYLTALAYVETEVDNYPAFLDPQKSQLAEALELQDGILQIWNDFDVLLIENNFSNARQHQAIHDMLSVVPRELHNLSSITMNVALGNEPVFGVTQIFPNKPQLGINIAEWDVALGEENTFPADVPAVLISPFMSALAHELTHVIDAYTMQQNESLAERRAMLLRDAGNEALNYLRSMFGDTVFQHAPQEFIASIGNQWFTNSEKTIQLGLTRFDNGRLDPINQALFMAEIFSLGSDETQFYIIDTGGNVGAQQIPLTRNELGFIDSLLVDNRVYQFNLDPQGRVTSYQVISAVPGDYNYDGTIDAADYIVWRKTLGQLGDNLSADGNGNDQIDAGDYNVWRANFARSIGGGSGAGSPVGAEVSEPAALSIVAVFGLMLCFLFGARRFDFVGHCDSLSH
jgi:hypothetical protein